MLENIFQTFLLLAYFNIALLSITIANYAVSASYLGRETRLSRRRIEKEKQELLEKIGKLKEEDQIEEVREQIKESDAKRRRLSVRIFLLSWLGAVILPSIFFLLSFGSAVLGMNSDILPYPMFLQQQLMISSVGTISIGFMILLYVIRTIDSAARKIPIPEFIVDFDGLRSVKCKSKEKKEITLCVTNKGEDIAENPVIFVCFPPEFEVHLNPPHDYYILKQSVESNHPDYNAAIFQRVDTIHTDITLALCILLTVPEKEGVYKIPIEIHERKIVGVYKDKLEIEIVK